MIFNELDMIKLQLEQTSHLVYNYFSETKQYNLCLKLTASNFYKLQARAIPLHSNVGQGVSAAYWWW